MTTATLYDRDFYAWTQTQAGLLRQAQFGKLDLTNLIEEIEDMGKNRQRELSGRLQVLLAHLLKWQFQPGHHSPSWETTIRNQRDELAELLVDNPSLRPQVAQYVTRAYPRSRRWAWSETGLDLKTFPITCPYTVQQILDEDFFPQ
jgi:hypothetical protein